MNELQVAYCNQLLTQVRQNVNSRIQFSRNFRIALEHTGKRAQETSDGLRLALATPWVIASMILDGRLNYERSNHGQRTIVLEGKFVNYEYIDVLNTTQKIETFGARLVIKEVKKGNKRFLVVSFHPDRIGELDLAVMPEVRHEPWS